MRARGRRARLRQAAAARDRHRARLPARRPAARRAGGRRSGGRARARSWRVDRRPADATCHVLLIEHDMDLVFSLCRPRSPCSSPARSSPKARRRRSPPIRACARSISARAHALTCCASRASSAGYGGAVVLRRTSTSSLAEGDSAGAARPQRRRQDHADRHAGRRDAAATPAASGSAAATSPRCAPQRAGGGRHRLGPAGAQHLRLAHRRREPERGRPAGAVDAAARLRAVSAAAGAPAQPGQPALRRRAADAGGGTRADAESEAACCSTSRWRASRPIIVEELLRSARAGSSPTSG